MKQNAQQDPGLESAGALEELARDPSSRRRFLKLMGGGAGAAGALSVFLAACGGSNSSSGTTGGAAAGTTMGTSTTSSMGGDVDIVNYALTLEYVEADFYKEVVSSGLFSGPQLDLIKAIGEYEQQLQELARKKHCDGIICGHIHTPEDKQVGEIRYLNSGDWVESMTAIVEHHDGRLELIRHEEFMAELASEVRQGRREAPNVIEMELSA